MLHTFGHRLAKYIDLATYITGMVGSCSDPRGPFDRDEFLITADFNPIVLVFADGRFRIRAPLVLQIRAAAVAGAPPVSRRPRRGRLFPALAGTHPLALSSSGFVKSAIWLLGTLVTLLRFPYCVVWLLFCFCWGHVRLVSQRLRQNTEVASEYTHN
jgi:hypothetical protein